MMDKNGINCIKIIIISLVIVPLLSESKAGKAILPEEYTFFSDDQFNQSSTKSDKDPIVDSSFDVSRNQELSEKFLGIIGTSALLTNKCSAKLKESMETNRQLKNKLNSAEKRSGSERSIASQKNYYAKEAFDGDSSDQQFLSYISQKFPEIISGEFDSSSSDGIKTTIEALVKKSDELPQLELLQKQSDKEFGRLATGKMMQGQWITMADIDLKGHFFSQISSADQQAKGYDAEQSENEIDPTVESMQKQVVESELKIARLKEEQKEQINVGQSLKEGFGKQYGSLESQSKEQNEKMQQALEQKNMENKLKSEEIESIKRALENCTNQKNNILNDLTDARTRTSAANAEKEAVKSALEQFINKKDDAGLADALYGVQEQISKKLTALFGTEQKNQQEKNNLKTKIEILAAENIRKVDLLKKENNLLKERNDRLSKEKTELSQQLDNKEAKIASLESSIKSLKNNLQVKESQLKNNFDTAKDQNSNNLETKDSVTPVAPPREEEDYPDDFGPSGLFG